MRQIALNIMSNSVKFTGAGGQVIVSTARRRRAGSEPARPRYGERHEREGIAEARCSPSASSATTSRWGVSGTGLALPITKALAEANHARFRIFSGVDAGTLVEVAFPATRVLAG